MVFGNADPVSGPDLARRVEAEHSCEVVQNGEDLHAVVDGTTANRSHPRGAVLVTAEVGGEAADLPRKLLPQPLVDHVAE